MTDLSIRKATEEEIPLIIDIQKEIFCGEQNIPEDLIGTFLSSQPICWIAEQNGRIIGSISSWEEKGEVHLGRFVVLPQFRGQKAGTKLLNHAVLELFQNGVEVIYVEARDSAARMIRAIGGRDTGEAFEFYLGNVTPMVLEKGAYRQGDTSFNHQPHKHDDSVISIRKANLDQFQDVRAFYHAVIDGIGDAQNSVKWKKDIYPSPEFLAESLNNGELFVAEESGKIIGAMILNHQGNDMYREYCWPTEAGDLEVTVIHALGVHPSFGGKGCAKQMVQFAIDYSRQQQQKAIRLDVLKGNLRAEKLYSGLGFQYLHTLPMYYEDTGWTDFQLYEYCL
jgi:ribosomal protein S18 acetylase RimI-like enzyme